MRLDILLIIGISLLASVCEAFGPNMDNCDWTGSGTLETGMTKGVQPVYLHCNQGSVRWHYPQGALRVILQHRTGSKYSFNACIRRTNSSSGARIYLAGKKTLHPVFGPKDPPDLVRCVASGRGHVTLYVEADPVADGVRRATAEFGYHLKKTSRRSLENFADECQPCSEEELLRQYCSSDYVIRGAVTGMFHNKLLQVTELTVRVAHMHKNNDLHEFPDLQTGASSRYVILQRPLKCGTKAGSGEYLFLGQWVLGNPTLNCVPRIAEWKKVRRRALLSGKNECLLPL